MERAVLLPEVHAVRITKPGFWNRGFQALRNRATPFWSLVRALEGKRRRSVPRPALDSAGVPAAEPSRVAELMGELFCTEFGHRVKIHSLDDIGPSSLHRGDQSPVEVPAAADVQAALEPLTGLLKMGKATSPDSAPNEILRGAGQNFITVFADLVVRVLREGAPKSWRGGTMTPVPKQAKKPMVRTTREVSARWESFTPSTSGATLRGTSSPQCCRPSWAAFPAEPSSSATIRSALPFSKQKGITSAVIFLDLTAAFYRALPELALGPLLDVECQGRAPVVHLPLAWRRQTIPRGSKLRFWTGEAPPWLHTAIADWHTDTLFRVRHTEQTYRLISGVRPGDPVADLIFNACMTGFIKELRKCLIEDGLLVSMQDLDGNPLEQARAVGDQERGVELDLDGTTWVDDHAVFTIAQDPNDAVHDIRTIMVTLEKVAARIFLNIWCDGYCLNDESQVPCHDSERVAQKSTNAD